MIISDIGIELAKQYDDARTLLPEARLRFDADRAEFIIVAGTVKIFPDPDIAAWRFLVEQREPGDPRGRVIGRYPRAEEAFAAAAAAL